MDTLQSVGNNPLIDLFKGVGPRAMAQWCDGKMGSRSFTEIFIILFHTLATFVFVAAATLGFYAYTHPLDFSNTTECPRLLMWVLVTSIVLSVYLVFNVGAMLISNSTFALVNLIVCVACIHMFFVVFNIFASVWIWSKNADGTPKYFNDAGCSTILQYGIKQYLIFWWVYYGLFIFFIVLSAFVFAKKADEIVGDSVEKEVTQKLAGNNV